MAFVPDLFEVPEGMSTEHLRLRVLTPAVVELDYAALMESRVRLRLWGAGDWPADDFTLAGNLADLEEHEREFVAREAFAYTVLNPTEDRCDGCVYINPLDKTLQHRRSLAEDFPLEPDERAASVSFWVRDSALDQELDAALLGGLMIWLQQDWPFSSVYFRVSRELERDHDLLHHAGLERQFSVASKSGRTEWQFWHLPTP